MDTTRRGVAITHSDNYPHTMTLQAQFGSIDIYVFDQLLKGRFAPGSTILDAGCGTGRNLVYFLRNGYNVYGVDSSAEAIQHTRTLAAQLAPSLPPEHFCVENLDSLSLPNSSMDTVICNAVLHFAQSEEQFHRIIAQLWRVLKPNGLLFCRLASTIGIEHLVQHQHGRWYALPDGTERFLVDIDFLMNTTHALGGTLLEPIKTVHVHNQRCMTTWCVHKLL